MDTFRMPDPVRTIVAHTRQKLEGHKQVLVLVGGDENSSDHHILQAALLDAFTKHDIDVTVALGVPENINARYLRGQKMSAGRTRRVLARLAQTDTNGHIRANGLMSQMKYDTLAWLPLFTAMRNGQPVMFVDAGIAQTGNDMHIPFDNRRTYDAAMANSIPMDQPLLREEPRGLHLRNKLMLADCAARVRQKATGKSIVILFTGKRHVAGTNRPFADLGVIAPDQLAGRQAPYHQSLHYMATNYNVPVVAFQLGGYDAYPRLHMPTHNPVVNVSDIMHGDVLHATVCRGPLAASGFQDDAKKIFDDAVARILTPPHMRLARGIASSFRPA